MPNNIDTAIKFLETQWSSINENKIKGINAELRFEEYLITQLHNNYQYLIPGGWIISPGKNINIDPPTSGRIAILPIPTKFSWTTQSIDVPFTAQVLAHSYFNQTGIKTYFTEFDFNGNFSLESTFVLPARRNYQISYPIDFYKVGPNGLEVVHISEVMQHFTNRTGNIGMRAYPLNRIDRTEPAFNDSALISSLFWKEYSRYFLHRNYLVSSNDLDFFLVSISGKGYPVEFKSKTVVRDTKIGDWFGIDIGPFTKLSFFVSLSNNMEALYFVEEVDNQGNVVEYWGIKFSTLLKYSFWVSQSGGVNMAGGASNTVKVPKICFEKVSDLLGKI